MSLIDKLSHPVVTMTAAVAIAAGLVAPSAIAQNNGINPCPDNLIVAFPGTGETNENADPNAQTGMLANITQPLTANNGSGSVQSYFVPYPSVAVDPNTGMTYAQSKQIGVDKASEEISSRIAECPNTHFSLTGYSQGADAAGDLAAAIGNGQTSIPADKITSVALLSDPGQSPGDNATSTSASTGFAGGRGGLGSLQDKASWVCNVDDIYCNTPTDKPALAMLGKLGANLDLNDPVRSVTAIVNAVSTANQPGTLDGTAPAEGSQSTAAVAPNAGSGSGDAQSTTPATDPSATTPSTPPAGQDPGEMDAQQLLQDVGTTVGQDPAGTTTAPQQPGANDLLTQLLGSVQQAASSGDPVTAERQLTKTKSEFESLGQSMSGTGLDGQIGPIIDEINVIFQTLLHGDLVGVAIKVAHLVPRVVAFAGHVATSVGQIVAKMPVAEFTQLAATTAAIAAAVSTQNYAVLPPLIGTWAAQASNVGGKVAESGALEELPGLGQTVLGLPQEGVVDEAVDFATFLASGAHTNYATQTLDSGRTGTQELSDFISQRLV